MMVKRKLDGAVNQEIGKCDATVHEACSYIAEPSLMAGLQAG